jgi:hypothetical protein
MPHLPNKKWSPDLPDEIRKEIYVVQTKIKTTEAGIFEVTSNRQCKFVIAKTEMEGTLHPCTLGGRSCRLAVQYATINSRSFFDKILSKKYAAFRNVMTQHSLYERSRAHSTIV